jgi:DNA-binding CsgD family transcriptional regulator
LPLGVLAALELWDDAALSALAIHQLRLARSAGDRVATPLALAQLAAFDDVPAGLFDQASCRLAQASELATTFDSPSGLLRIDVARLVLAVWRGSREEAVSLADRCTRSANSQGLDRYGVLARGASAVLDVALGRYEEAVSAGLAVLEQRTFHLISQYLPELVEAAVRVEERGIASAALKRLSQITSASGTRWGLGTLARSRALLASGDDAEGLFRDAIDRLGGCRMATSLARAHLLYGEWLRRERRQRDARRHLREALRGFRSMGATAFAARAETELMATGEHPQRAGAAVSRLTPQETRIARLVAEGSSNAEIAARLFISRRTVEHHLGSVFTKVGVTTRAQLAGQVTDESRPA